MKKYIYILSLLGLTMLSITACTKLKEERPEDAFTEDDAIKTPQDVQNLLNSCYDALANQLNGRVQYFNDLLSDDLAKPLKDDAGFSNEIYNRSTNIFNSDIGAAYRNLYLIPFRVNNLELYYDKVNVSAEDRKRMDAEGKFLRALCHFEVLKLWAQPAGFDAGNGHPGIVLRKEVSQLPGVRATVAESFDFIISDLQVAIANLPPSNGNYANQYAAKALLAKVYYMMNRPNDALPLLNDVIAGSYVLGKSVNHFQNDSMQSEYIFAMISTNASSDNRSGEFTGKYRSDTKQPDFVLTKDLYQILTDTSGFKKDKRGKQNVAIFNEGKDNEFYAVTKFNKDYFSVPYLTLTDMLLLRAELSAEAGDLATAITDVNKIIARAYNDSATQLVSSAANQTFVLDAVRLQRRLEFFGEGDRVQTLKRRGGKGESVTIRTAPWNCPGMVLQFPSVENGAGFVFNGTGGCN